MSRRVVAIAFAVVLLFALGAASCVPPPQTTPVFQKVQPFRNNGKPKIAFEGDSLTAVSADWINMYASPAWDVSIAARGGATTWLIDSSLKWIPRDAALKPKVAVINLGTNDAKDFGIDTTFHQPIVNLPGVLARFDTINAEWHSSTCVVWVTINTHNPSWRPDIAAAINAHIKAKFAHVADWNAAWTASYFSKPDDPHPNESGKLALLGVEAAAIRRCPK